MNQPIQVTIDTLSQVPLLIYPRAGDLKLGTATGFLLQDGASKFWLITNWHVVSGRNAETNAILHSTGATPDCLEVHYHRAGPLGQWNPRVETLIKNGLTQWKEFVDRPRIDVVALPVTTDSERAFYPLPHETFRSDIHVLNSEDVSIIGFPMGETSFFNFPIWKTGHVASDIEIPAKGNPMFLIDARTKVGLSGAPVIKRWTNGFTSKNVYHAGARAERFLGVYSGRTSIESDIGMVWKADIVKKLLDL